MIGCRACRMLRKKKSSADFNGRRICSQCRADRFPHRPAWIEVRGVETIALSKIQDSAVNLTLTRARLLIDVEGRGSVAVQSAKLTLELLWEWAPRVRNASDPLLVWLARRAPFIASHMAPPLPTLKNTSSDSKKFELANSRLEVGSYPELASSRLPPMFALLSAYLTTKYPGVQRVILEVDDTLRAGAKESLNG
ncbi:uncharacterized protein EI90DRAFT_3012873 [Cantharellus anzutake]|uniref:uncharacterized protein n=1 Tax=Cantharellus anzutake TaxID=1750568 RepID=UPI001907B579|nr:uncharacterized protein EI90DRAFT_3012873 [Cantharellus anzutake]KAF8339976.1 hypothetical protein EI90DRAFT_3012873 [Cantharellus anzutake]